MRQRWLDTASGQWLSVDPVEGEPRYSYAYNSPTQFVDPSGEQTVALDRSVGVFTPNGAYVSKEDLRYQSALRNSSRVAPGQFGYLLVRSSQNKYFLVPREVEFWQLQGSSPWYTNTHDYLRKVIEQVIAGDVVHDVYGNQLSFDDYRLVEAVENSRNHGLLPYLSPADLNSLLLVQTEYGYILIRDTLAWPSSVKAGTKVVHAKGIAGPIIDKWFVQEIKHQVSGVVKWFTVRKKAYWVSGNWEDRVLGSLGGLGQGRTVSKNSRPTIEELLDWANANELYKWKSWYDFKTPPGLAATQDAGASVGCKATLTLFDKCILRSILGNMVYGFIARYLGFSRSETASTPEFWKKFLRPVVKLAEFDPYDRYAYLLGLGQCAIRFAIWDTYVLAKTNIMSLSKFCERPSTMRCHETPMHLLEGKGDNAVYGVNDYSTCRKCAVVAAVNSFHGGNVDAVIAPLPKEESVALLFKEALDHELTPAEWDARKERKQPNK